MRIQGVSAMVDLLFNGQDWSLRAQYTNLPRERLWGYGLEADC